MDLTRATKATSKQKEATFPEASMGVRLEQLSSSTSIYLMNPSTVCSPFFFFFSFGSRSLTTVVTSGKTNHAGARIIVLCSFLEVMNFFFLNKISTFRCNFF